MIVGLSPDKLQAAERTLGADRRVRTLAADVTKEAEIAWLFDEVGAFDRLVSTAGTPPRAIPLIVPTWIPIDRTDMDVVRRFVDKEQVARRTRNISAEGNLTLAGKFGTRCGGDCAISSVLSLSCLRSSPSSHSIRRDYAARRRSTRLGFRAPVCHPEVALLTGNTWTRPRSRSLDQHSSLAPVQLRGDVMAARMKLWWGSKLAMVDRLAMADGLVGALARVLADGSHV
ncbi:MAG: hypothetical protein E5W87_22740 [Mesorhizobium sp.]|nr:MAG: hypothetical protein E5W87_22740 [Mesorhizobium sp.]